MSRTRGMLALATALLAAPAALAAQAAVHVGLGARYSGTLVRDSIVTGLVLRPAVAPALAVTIALPAHRGWSGDVALDVSWSHLRLHPDAGSSTELGGLTVVTFAVGLRRSLAPRLGARVAVGGLRYLPARESGVFRGGAAELHPLVGVGVDYAPPIARGITVELRADAHRFLTRALRDAGFTEHRLVPRVTLAARLDLTRLP